MSTTNIKCGVCGRQVGYEQSVNNSYTGDICHTRCAALSIGEQEFIITARESGKEITVTTGNTDANTTRPAPKPAKATRKTATVKPEPIVTEPETATEPEAVVTEQEPVQQEQATTEPEAIVFVPDTDVEQAFPANEPEPVVTEPEADLNTAMETLAEVPAPAKARKPRKAQPAKATEPETVQPEAVVTEQPATEPQPTPAVNPEPDAEWQSGTPVFMTPQGAMDEQELRKHHRCVLYGWLGQTGYKLVPTLGKDAIISIMLSGNSVPATISASERQERARVRLATAKAKLVKFAAAAAAAEAEVAQAEADLMAVVQEQIPA